MGTLKQTNVQKRIKKPKHPQKMDPLKRRFQNVRFVSFSDSVSVFCVHSADLVEQDHRDPKALAVLGSLVAGDTGAILANWNELKFRNFLATHGLTALFTPGYSWRCCWP